LFPHRASPLLSPLSFPSRGRCRTERSAARPPNHPRQGDEGGQEIDDGCRRACSLF
uniref:Uncharacterized protein n=1 Tax=Aegilops tauschii subsp. strangulata TaxID=200361 RepID=A0A453KVI5_AEGTS